MIPRPRGQSSEYLETSQVIDLLFKISNRGFNDYFQITLALHNGMDGLKCRN